MLTRLTIIKIPTAEENKAPGTNSTDSQYFCKKLTTQQKQTCKTGL